MEIFFLLAALILSIIVHEVAHGAMADYLGDHTARYAGRLTFNPIRHFDFMGSFLVPLLCFLLPTRLVFGWAKPVPINPYNFRDQKYGSLKVAFAGPGSNLLVASFFGLVGRFLPLTAGERISIFNSFNNFLGSFRTPETLMETGFVGMLFFFFLIIIFINVLLAIVNLIPIPPLDGSHILFTFLPKVEYKFKEFAARSGIMVLPLMILAIYFVLPLAFTAIYFVFRVISGV